MKRASLWLALAVTLGTGLSVHAQDRSRGVVPEMSPAAQKALAFGSSRVIDVVMGDLNGDGRDDALVVLDPPAGSKAGQGRDLVILVRDAAGNLKKVAHNDKIIPCATCAGASGDPYKGIVGGSRPGEFAVKLEGGSRERWSDTYTFNYEDQYHQWFFIKGERRVEDTATGQIAHAYAGASDFWVEFGQFDPSVLPEATLPEARRGPPPKVEPPVNTMPVNPYAKNAKFVPVGCPAEDFPSFFIAFANSPRVQRSFVADPFFSQTVEDEASPGDGKPVTRQLHPDQVSYPLLPTIEEQADERLTVQQRLPTATEAEVQISKDDTDYQMTITFKKQNGCWRATRLQDDTL